MGGVRDAVSKMFGLSDCRVEKEEGADETKHVLAMNHCRVLDAKISNFEILRLGDGMHDGHIYQVAKKLKLTLLAKKLRN